MDENYKIDIESQGKYDSKKEFNKISVLSEREFLGLITTILDYLDKLPVRLDLPKPPEED